MPVIMIRGQDLDRDTATRVKAYARAHDISTSAAASQLLTIALEHLDARAAGANAVNNSRTKAERSESARAAVTARWDKERRERGEE